MLARLRVDEALKINESFILFRLLRTALSAMPDSP